MPRIVLLDLLRGLAAFSVAVAHYFGVNSTDQHLAEAIASLSVEIFFVLSGFVLGSQVVYCVRSGQLRNLWTFLVRRWIAPCRRSSSRCSSSPTSPAT